MCLFFLLNNSYESDTTDIDSASARRFEIPEIINFSNTGILDSALEQKRIIEPVVFLSGFQSLFHNTPYLIREKGYINNVLYPFPPIILINSHILEQYFSKEFNFALFPLNFTKFVAFAKKYINSGVNSIDLNTKFNIYHQPYSHLYFTLFGLNTVYNIDFTRAITQSTGLYLSGVYARQYKKSEHRYYRTNAGYANFYNNQFIPMRIDILATGNSYDTVINTDFSDVILTAGKDFYKLTIFRTAEKVYNPQKENQFSTYGTQHKFLFNVGGFENIFEISGLSSQFNPGQFKYKSIEFSQRTNYKFNNIIAGIGYNLDYDGNKFYFEPDLRLKHQIFNDAKVFIRSGLFTRRANFVAQYGNEKFVDKIVNIVGNKKIKDEIYFHKEIGIIYKRSMINLYNSTVKNQIIYQLEANNRYSVVNVDNVITGIEGILVTPKIKNFSATGVCNYLLDTDSPLEFADFLMKLIFNWHWETERSETNFFTKIDFIGARYNSAGKYYGSFYTISSGLEVRFLTLKLGVIFDNLTDTRPLDFPDMARNVSVEIKWEFWD